MKSTLVAQTLLHSLRPVGSQAERDHGLLRETLRRELGPEAGDFFAEPVPSQDGSRIDWYVPASSRPEAAASLGQEDRTALMDAFEARREAIQALASRLDAGSQGDREAARALRHALEMPSTDAIYRVDGKPVVVGWGFVEMGRPSYASGLKATTAAAPRAVPQPTSTATGREAMPAPAAVAAAAPASRLALGFPWLAALFWLLLLLLLLALCWLLLSLGLLARPAWLARSSILPSWSAPVGSSEGLARIAGLRTELDGLERRAVEANALCAAQAAEAATPAVTEPVPPVPEPETDLDERIEQSGAQSGELQISLIWDGQADLDLSVICPGNARLYFRSPQQCGGILDTDANSSGRTPNPVENIYWAPGTPIPAGLPVEVTYFAPQGDPRAAVPYQLRIRRTTIDPATGQPAVSDEVIDGIAKPSEKGVPQRVTTVGEP